MVPQDIENNTCLHMAIKLTANSPLLTVQNLSEKDICACFPVMSFGTGRAGASKVLLASLRENL